MKFTKIPMIKCKHCNNIKVENVLNDGIFCHNCYHHENREGVLRKVRHVYKIGYKSPVLLRKDFVYEK